MVTRHHHRERGDYFSSTAPLEAMNYTYSRQFGAPVRTFQTRFISTYLGVLTRLQPTSASFRLLSQFTGLGVGLGITRQYCRGIYGGSLSIESMPRHGCDAYLRLERRGNVMF